MTDRELRDQLLTMLVAGHETTATALAWAFERLLRNPAVLVHVTAELAQGSTTYLDATIKEVLRLRPVVPITARKITVPFTVGGRTYEPGTVLMPCIYLLHRHPDIYERPEEFLPERFLEQSPPSYAWIPFGGGVRRCLGSGFALAEMRAVMQTVLTRVELRAGARAARARGPARVHDLTARGRAGGRAAAAGLGAPRQTAQRAAGAGDGRGQHQVQRGSGEGGHAIHFADCDPGLEETGRMDDRKPRDRSRTRTSTARRPGADPWAGGQGAGLPVPDRGRAGRPGRAAAAPAALRRGRACSPSSWPRWSRPSGCWRWATAPRAGSPASGPYLAVLATTGVLLFTHSDASPYMLFYLWVVFYAFYFLGTREAIGLAAFATLNYALVLVVLPRRPGGHARDGLQRGRLRLRAADRHRGGGGRVHRPAALARDAADRPAQRRGQHRPDDRAAQPARVPGRDRARALARRAQRPARQRAAGRLRPVQELQHPPRQRGRRLGAAADRPDARGRPPARGRGRPDRRRGVRRDPARHRPARGLPGGRAPAHADRRDVRRPADPADRELRRGHLSGARRATARACRSRPRTPCTRPRSWAATAASCTARRWPRSCPPAATARTSATRPSWPPCSTWPRRWTCATRAPPATPRPWAATAR